MGARPITDTLRHIGGGKTASSTSSAKAALERLAEKLLGPGEHRIETITQCDYRTKGVYRIHPELGNGQAKA